MGAVDVGVGHDDDLVVAQVVEVELACRCRSAEASQRSEISALVPSFDEAAPSTLRILPLSGSRACVVRSRAPLAEPPALSPSTMKSSVPSRVLGGAVGELAGQAQFLGGGLALGFLLLPAAQAFLGAQHEEIEDRAGGFGVGGQPVVEVVAHGVLDEFGGLDGGEAVLGLAYEFGFADEAGHERAAAREQVLAGDLPGLAVVRKLAVGADALEDRGPEARFMGAAFGGRHGVAVGLQEAVARGGPVDRPFDLARRVEFLAEIDGAGEGLVGVGGRTPHGFAQVVGEAAGEVEAGLRRGFAVVELRISSGFRRPRRGRPWSGSILKRRAGLKRWWPKICSSAWKVTVVPRRFWVGPSFAIGPSGMPREKRCS